MVAHVGTVAFLGLDARPVEVQVQMAGHEFRLSIVGLPDKAVRESGERVRAALEAIGLALPPRRITVNLSPADLPKEGSHYDLPIALGLLAAMGMIDAETLAQYVAVGELGLDGRLAPVPGVLLAALHASSASLGLICPASQGGEAAWAGEVEVVAAPDLLSLINHLKGVQLLSPPTRSMADLVTGGPDLSEIKGQETAKRALEIAAAGGHNLLSLYTATLCAYEAEWTLSSMCAGRVRSSRVGRAARDRSRIAASMRPRRVGGSLPNWKTKAFRRSTVKTSM